MIPPALALYFERCERGEASPGEYARAMAELDAAFTRNQAVAANKARRLRADCYVSPSKAARFLAGRQREAYQDRQMAAAGDV